MSQPPTDISAIICAYTEERWGVLRAAVTSLQQQTHAAREIILVIDHNPELYLRARTEFPGVVVVENQAQAGLSGSRNTGSAAAQGALLAFLDDDAIAPPNWLESMQMLCAPEGILGAGCAIAPLWPGERPRWFPEEFGWVVGCTYRGLPETRAKVRNLIGCAMCLRREVATLDGGFASELGRVGKRPVGGEETDLCIRALQRWPEGAFIFEPALAVQHHVTPERARWRYFRDRCYFEGRSKAVLSKRVGRQSGLSSEQAYTLRTLPRGVARGLADAIQRGDSSGLARAWAIILGLSLTMWGYLIGRVRGS
jgi:glycosyltransferase involved in cell wall biosynthesis